MNTLITFRGLATLLLATYLLTGPGSQQSDIVAGIFGLTLLSLAAICLALFLYNFYKIRDALTLNLRADQGQRLYALEKNKIFLKLSKLYLLPLFELHIKAIFKNSSENFPSIVITKNLNAETEELLNWSFPHRGIWQIEKFLIIFRDRLGFFEIKRDFGNSAAMAIEILPAKQLLSPLPLIVSAYAPGDSLPVADKPQGDYYELKKYQPADGSKKIVWKIFARTGELITRHPEETVSPEGKTVIFLLADKNGDAAAFAALEYIKKLEQEKIEVLASSAGNHSGIIANSSVQFTQQILEAVWLADTDPLESLRTLTENARKMFPLENLLIFCQSQIAAENLNKFKDCLKFASSFNSTCISCKLKSDKQQAPGIAGRFFKNNPPVLVQENIHTIYKQIGLRVIEC